MRVVRHYFLGIEFLVKKVPSKALLKEPTLGILCPGTTLMIPPPPPVVSGKHITHMEGKMHLLG